MDSRAQYMIPGPPPILSPQQNPMMPLPPPPPRPPPTPHTMMPPPPPGPYPGHQQQQQGLSVNWVQQGWGRLGFPPPPPPPINANLPSSAHMVYNNSPAYQTHQPPPISIPPRQQYAASQAEGQPLTSATYIPGGESFGPGVGIPPLHTQQQQQQQQQLGYSRGDNNDFYATVEAMPVVEHRPIDNHRFYHDPVTNNSPSVELPGYNVLPQTPLSRHHPCNYPGREADGYDSPGPRTATRQALQNRTGLNDGGLDPAPSSNHSYNNSNSSNVPLSPNDPALQWPIDRVLIWLAANGFSNEWQETFKMLDIQEASFLELGRANGGRGNFGIMHNSVYPNLAKECNKSGSGWDPVREREEGKRMRRLIRKIAEASGGEDMRAHSRRYSSQPLPSAGSEGGVEYSPNLNTPSTAGPGEESPGLTNHFRSTPTSAVGNRTASGYRNAAPPSQAGQKTLSSDPSLLETAQQSYAHTRITREILRDINGSSTKRHSPSNSGEGGGHSFSGAGFRGDGMRPDYDASPGSSSPATLHATISTANSGLSAPFPGRFGHHKSNSTDSVASNNSQYIPSTSMPLPVRSHVDSKETILIGRLQDERRRHAQETSRPLALEFGKQSSTEAPSMKEHGKGFLSKFRKRAKKEDSSQALLEDLNPESPTSPTNYRHVPPTLPFVRQSRNNSNTSLERPSSTSTMSEQEKSVLRGRAVLRGSAERTYVFATPDRYNYRLIDVTFVDTPDTLRDMICNALNIPDSDAAQIFLTEAGQMDHDEQLTDTMLQICKRTRADSKGSLKFYVRAGSAPPSATSAPLFLSNGLGLYDYPPRAMPSPTVSISTQRKPLDEGSHARVISNNHLRSDSPPLSSRQGTIKASQNGAPSPGLPLESPTVQVVKERLETVDASLSGDTVSEADREASLQAAVLEYRREIQKKQRAYFEAKQAKIRKESPTDSGTWSIKRGNGVIDFDTPRDSPYEEKKTDALVPLRKPPPAPADSITLNKANSLTKKVGEAAKEALSNQADYANNRRSAGENITEDTVERGRRRAIAPTPSVSAAIGSGLEATGALAGDTDSPTSSAAATEETSNRPSDGDSAIGRRPRALQTIEFGRKASGRNSPGGSPRSPGFTYGKNQMLFKVPDYDPDVVEVQETRRPSLTVQTSASHPSLEHLRKPSPNISPSSTAPIRKPSLANRKSYGPAFSVKEGEVQFAQTPMLKQDDSGDDSDDGLFARPLAKPSRKPTITVDTRAERVKSVTFAATPDTSTATARTAGTDYLDDTERSFNSSIEPDYSALDSALSPGASTQLGRRKSIMMRDDVWANRPPTEALLENLDAYFPNVDLDQPVLEDQQGSPPASPMSANDQNPMDSAPPHGPQSQAQRFSASSLYHSARPLSIVEQSIAEEPDSSDTLGSQDSTLKSNSTLKSVAQRNIRKAGGLARMKSIREVAKGANQVSRRHNPKAQGTAKSGDLVRRKSTKMFGANIVQINPGRGSRMSLIEAVSSVPEAKRPTTFQIYRGEMIGKGTYGRVYLGVNANTGEILAIKQIEVNPKAAGQDKEKIRDMVNSLDQEIDTMQHLDHANIVQYLGCERQEFSISIFLEYISGGSIGSCLRKHGKFPEDVVSSLTRQTLEGLSYLHGQGILHRDLKADNILLDMDGTCKISDFGISKRSDNIYGNDITNNMQGSVFWMAPEVIRSQGQGYSAKVDIWSLGCVVLEMFAGRRPWAKEEAIGAIYKLGSLNQAPPIPDDVSSSISLLALSFMYDCFTIDPGNRPTAQTLKTSEFCKFNPYFNFLDTELHRRIDPNRA